MDAKHSRAARCAAFLLPVVTLATAGCESLNRSFHPLSALSAAAAASNAAQAARQAEQPAPPPPADLAAALADDAWVLALSGADGQTPQYRWRHPQLAGLVTLSPEQTDQLKRQLAADNATAANAAIVLARGGAAGGDRAVVERLADTVRSRRLKQSLRAAAAESLRQPDEATLATLRALIDEQGQLGPAGQSHYDPVVHAALVSALATVVPADQEPRLAAALESPAAEVRREAVRALTAQPNVPLPEALVDLRTDSDAQVRAETLRALAAHRHVRAHEYLSAALKDYDANVRLAAIASLGRLGSDEARATLDLLKRDPQEISRTAAVAALGALGADQSLLEAAADRSWRVRQAAAEALAAIPRDAQAIERQSKELARQLVSDASSQVQQSAVASLAAWPLGEAGPLLLAAMAEGSYQARQAAAAQLAERWPPAKAFSVDAPAERRREVLAALHRQWSEQFGTLADAARDAVERRVAEAAGVTPEQLTAINDLLVQLDQPRLPGQTRREVIAGLRAYGPALIAALEQKVRDEGRLPPEIYSDLLPGLSPIFGELDRLTSKDVAERRAAARAVAAQAQGKPLSELALRRLAEVVALENDALVWSNVLDLTAADARQTATELAYAAVGHASAEVRRRAVDYLQQHASPQHAAVLVPMLQDPSSSVVIGAIRALGAAGRLDNPAPLVALLGAGDKLVEVEAAISLAQLRVAEGRAAIERLAYETNQDVRRRLASALGEINDPVYLPTLMLLLSDKPDVQRAALASLAVVAGRDVARGDSAAPLPPAEQVRRWQQWYRESGGAVGGQAQGSTGE